MKSFLAGVLCALAVLAAVGLGVVYGGLYDVAASDGHAPLLRWVYSTTMENAVRRRADGVAPATFDLEEGHHLFAQSCAHCHGAPGVDPEPWAEAMSPDPPRLSHAAEEWTLEQVHWIVRHGIESTGMPAFGALHDEQALWDVAAFVEQLPAMTAEEYRAMGERGTHTHTH